MKIAFALIVFNGEPYISKWLKHYIECPYVDYVVVAEGATQNMFDVMNLKNASSNDNTISELISYSNNQKFRFCNAKEPYTEKVYQQNAYVDLLPDDTDYIWIADVDEFYHYRDIAFMRYMLEQYSFTFVEFRAYHFWKNLHTVATGGKGWGYDQPFDRLFKYHPGARFTDHRPIQMMDCNGVPLKIINALKGSMNPVMLYHYSYITEKMVYEKMLYYRKTFNRDYINNWYIPVWKSWTEENRDDIESKYSIHPTVPGGKTKFADVIHPVDVSDLIITP